MNDHTLLAEFVATRKPAAFAELVSRYEALVRAAAVRQVADAHLADDITQSTMMTLMTKAARIRRDQPLGPWLLRVTYFLSLDALRTDSARRRHEQIAAGQRNEIQEHSVAVLPNATDSILDRALNALRERDRTVLVLRYLQGWTFEQIAAELNIKTSATRQRLSRAAKRLRALLDEQGVRRDEIFPALFPPLVAEINNYLARPHSPRSPLHKLLRRYPRLFHPVPVSAAAALLLVCGVTAGYVLIHRTAASQQSQTVNSAHAMNAAPFQNSRPESTIP